MTINRVLPSDGRRALYTLNLIALLDLLAVSLFLPLINREIKSMGGSPFIMGLVTSVYGGIQLLSSPIFGHSSDVYGRKPVILASLIVAALGYIMLGSASSLSMILVARIISGFFKHTQTLSKVVLTDLAPKEKSYVLGNFNAFGSMGFIIGPTIGGHLVESENGFRNVCYLAAALFILNSILMTVMVPETLSASHKKDLNLNNEPTPKRERKCCPETKEMSRLTVLAILAIRFLFCFSTLVPRANLLLIMESKYAASVVSISYLNSLQATVATLTGFTVGPVILNIYKENNRRMVMHGSILTMIALIALYFSPSFQMAGLALMLLSATNPFMRVGITSLSLGESNDDHGAILGLGQTSSSLARMFAPLAAGLAQQGFSEDGPALFGAIAAFLGGICIMFFIPRNMGSSYVKHKST